MRYFRKANPKVSVLLSNGMYAGFEKVDHETAIFATEQPFLLGEFDACIKGQRGGIMEIGVEEYGRLKDAKKNGPPLKPIWREELSNQQMRIDAARRQKERAASLAEPVGRAEPMVVAPEVPLVANRETVVEPVLDPALLRPAVAKRPAMPPKKK